jgi:hypothetical protein
VLLKVRISCPVVILRIESGLIVLAEYVRHVGQIDGLEVEIRLSRGSLDHSAIGAHMRQWGRDFGDTALRRERSEVGKLSMSIHPDDVA